MITGGTPILGNLLIEYVDFVDCEFQYERKTGIKRPQSFPRNDPLSHKVRGLALSSAYRVDHQSWKPSGVGGENS